MSRKLFVGNLPYSVTSERLQEAFAQFGTVTSSKVIVDRETGRSRGFAFLEILLFVGILFLGLVYAWAKGDLEWIKKVKA